MRYRRVGDSDLTVSVVALGCTAFGGSTDHAGPRVSGTLGLDEARRVVDAALDAGVTLFDLADIHAEGRAESIFGEAIKGRRDNVIIATKWGADVRERPDLAHGSRRYIRRAVEASLRRLQTDYIDLYQMHWQDPRTPLEETLRALDELVSEGKIRYAGSSHLAGWEVADADWLARAKGLTRFVSAQNHYNLLERDVELDLVPACERFGVGLLTYFPLGKGLLGGKYRRERPQDAAWLANRVVKGEIDARVFSLLEALERFATERGRTLPELAVAWLVAQRAVTSVLTGASTPDQIRANAAASEWELTDQELAEVRTLIESPTVIAA